MRRRGAWGGIPSTIYRELERNGSGGGYDAETAQHRADGRARRPKEAKLAADPELAAAMVCERLAMRWSPHAVCSDLRAQGRRLSAETIYAACRSASPILVLKEKR